MHPNDKDCATNTCAVGASKGGCPKARCLIMFVAAFVVLMGFDWLFHGVFMMPHYTATASVWRPMEQMEQMFGLCLLRHLVEAAVFVCFFKHFAGAACPVRGAKFGGKVGLLIGISTASFYIWLPIPGDIAIYWLIGDTVRGALAGAVLGAINMKCKSGDKMAV